MVDRSEQEQGRLARVVDGLPAWKLWAVMEEVVGAKRAVELLGWAVVWGLSGEVSGTNLRRKLEAQGMTYASAYRAIADYRRVGDRLLELDGYDGPGVLETLRSLAREVA